MAAVLFPMAAGDLLGDEIVGRFRVGDPQQRLGDAHEDDAFLARKAVLAHEGVDAGVLAAVGARRMHEPASKVGGAAALVLAEHRTLDEPVEQPLLVDEMVRGDFIARRQQPRPLMNVIARLDHLHRNHAALVRAPR